MRTPAPYAACLVAMIVGACASRPPEPVRARFVPATSAEAAAATVCRAEGAGEAAVSRTGGRAGSAAAAASKVIVGESLSERSLGLYLLTAPVALAAGAAVATFGAASERAAAQSSADVGLVACVRSQTAPPPVPPLARDGAAELRALGVEPTAGWVGARGAQQLD